MSYPVTPASRPKRIIICCDGTWQSATSGKKNVPSNVTRLARELDRVGVDAEGNEWQQLVWYDSGVGTTSLLGRKSEGATGSGLEINVIEAYNFIVLNWVPGDKVYCFGFSRGAFTARAIAGLISDIGICEPRMLQHFSELWGLYKANKEERFWGSKAYWEFMDGKLEEPLPETPGYKNSNYRWKDKPKGNWASIDSREIEIVGVYDTVGALGMPSLRGIEVGSLIGFDPEEHKFFNVRLNRNIKRAYHALALDERREAFTPTLFYLSDDYPFKGIEIEKQHAAFEAAFDKWHAASTDRKMSVEKKRQIKQEYDRARQTIVALEADAIKAQKEVHHKPPPELSQVWFPGVHINVGGGSSDTLENKGDMEELADVVFCWMLDQIRPHLNINSAVYEQYRIERSQNLDELNKQAREEKERLKKERDEQKKESYMQTGYRWVSTSAQSVVDTAADNYNSVFRRVEKEKPKNQTFFNFGWGTGSVIDSYTWTYVANGYLARTPNGYHQNKKLTTRGRTHESVHPVVGYRMYSSRKKYRDAVIAAANAKDDDEKKELEEECKKLKSLIYNPIGMKSGDEPMARRCKNEATQQWEYKFHGCEKPLPEWNMRPNEMSQVLSYEGMTSIPEDDALWYAVNAASYERRALHGDAEADAYLTKLDEINGYKSYWSVQDVTNPDLEGWFDHGKIPDANVPAVSKRWGFGWLSS
ncbi:hypothetical protein PFICI_14652 [Pestalotiopsis fici W106-1]|uniref:T6SS Phospholipase effector Tle1-like catalytic domain-containing protein n=1 Tax=Pestalotiopsis fici (strain W106-1 / CGMCC3.15140) TaxID=1229662 RepID=W3WLL2_PESFW|nr:uncharacterized protein PFICI_14652 [Pestalotiopsis fici W106-1]ETS73706.1 hypothetical protein PFICI_14652 [Pestalotiopsis fici W106-1]